jgi:SAM-dependent methyltransferase
MPRVQSAARSPERIAWAVEQLVGDPARRILEVGAGAGHAVARLCAERPTGVVTAIDRSALQVARARARNREAIAAGRARIEQLALDDAPTVLGAGAYDAALAINVNAFWTAPAASLARLAELLRPGGRAYLVYEPPSASALRTVRARLASAFVDHGFTLEAVREAACRPSGRLCLVGRVSQ